jgi:hypothetical protein
VCDWHLETVITCEAEKSLLLLYLDKLSWREFTFKDARLVKDGVTFDSSKQRTVMQNSKVIM